MNTAFITTQLLRNGELFRQMLSGATKDEYTWRPAPEKWCLLEIACHLYDEEREDFRARLAHVFEHPEQQLPPIDPVGWVSTRKYSTQDYETMIGTFIAERKKSVEWLNSLKNPKWENACLHPKFGPLSASLFFNNWLAHDYLHIRQITAVKYHYLKEHANTGLDYAGTW